MTPGRAAAPAAALALVLLLPAPALGQAGGGAVVVDVSHALGGLHKEWGVVPADVTLFNRSDRDRTVVIECTQPHGRFVREVELPAGSRKRVTFYVTIEGYAPGLPIVVRDGSGTVLVEAQLASMPVPEERTAVGVIGDAALGWETVRDELDSGVMLAYLEADRLPSHPAVLDAFDAIVWPEPRPDELRAEQVRAIARWIDGGGILILCVQETWLEARAGGLAPWTGIRVRGTRPVDGFASIGLTLDRSSTSATVLEADPATALLRESWGVVGAFERRALGGVTVLGFDPGAETLATWTGWPGFWTEFAPRLGLKLNARLQRGRPGWYPRSLQANLLVSQAYDETIRPPYMGWVVLLFVGYLFVIGPLEYALLARRGRLAWTWVVFPVVVGLVSAVTYGVAAASYRGDPRLSHIVVRNVLPASDSVTDEVLANYYVIRQGNYTIRSLDPDALPFDVGGGYGHGFHEFAAVSRFDQAPPSVTARAPKWTNATAVFLEQGEASGARVDGGLTNDGKAWAGWVHPRLGRDLAHAWVVASHDGKRGRASIGGLADDRRTPVAFELEPINRHGPPSLSKSEIGDVVSASLAADPGGWKRFFDAGGIALVGVADDPEPRVATEAGDAAARGVIVFRVPLTIGEGP